MNMQYQNTRALVRTLIAVNPQANWSIQGLGMLRLPLPGGRRLHIWDDRFRWVEDARRHTHPWSFESYIVSGQINNTRYLVKEGQHASWMETVQRREIKCGPGSCALSEPVTVGLFPRTTEIYTGGDTYSQFADEAHMTTAIDGTITIINRWDDTERAHVFYTNEWDNAEARKPTEDELKAIIGNALDLMASED